MLLLLLYSTSFNFFTFVYSLHQGHLFTDR